MLLYVLYIIYGRRQKKLTFGFVYTAFRSYENGVKTIHNDRSSSKNDHLYFLKHAKRSCVGTHACEKRFVLIIVQLTKYFTSKLNKY